MKIAWVTTLAAAFLLGGVLAEREALGNGGPFVVKSPNGDPAAKGVLARLDATLKPAQETRLRVVKEDLTIEFASENTVSDRVIKMPPLVTVKAAYQIENLLNQEVVEDFGFPILRGIYLRYGMVAYPDVRVTVDKGEDGVPHAMLSNSVIYGVMRRNARAAIEQGIATDKRLADLTGAVRNAWAKQTGKPGTKSIFSDDLDIPFGSVDNSSPARLDSNAKRTPTADYLPAREKLRDYLTTSLQWSGRDAALLVEYASLEFAAAEVGLWRGSPYDRWDICLNWDDQDLERLKAANLGPLAAIGEQKATQMFIQLAARFGKDIGSTYEAVFAAWGGDVRERSLDLGTGEIRPREVTVPSPKPSAGSSRNGRQPDEYDGRLTADRTVYARVEYLDAEAKISKEEKASCEAILKNLPVVFTFAPMNLLHYQVKFAPRSTHLVTVAYKQYAYADTRGSGSYQLAYVLHPATLWKEFGPIELTLQVPDGISCRASVPTRFARREQPRTTSGESYGPQMATYTASLQKPEEKRGELFIALDKAAWDSRFAPSRQVPPRKGAPVASSNASPRQKAD